LVVLPCLIFEDEHLLAVNKPAGLNTHAPSPFAGEGLYDWLRHREPRWARLAIIHRLDKETSGVMVFSKTPLANRVLTEQFAQRRVRKKYLLLTDRPVPSKELVVKSSLIRAGEKYVSRPVHAGGEPAETRFLPGVATDPSPSPLPTGWGEGGRGPGEGEIRRAVIEARPLTGRTHQIRVHAAQAGFPILGDTLYGGTPAPRVCLHAAELTLKHPESGKEMTWSAPVDFAADPRALLRTSLLDPEATNACCLVHGASDGWPAWYVDRLGDYLMSQSAQPLTAPQGRELERLMSVFSARGAYHKVLTRQVRRASAAEAAPQLILGEAAPARFIVRENRVPFTLSLAEGYSVGLFLDQRDNHRRLLTGHVAADFPLLQAGPGGQPVSFRVLNAFAYTCGFSVCAAKAGACTTSLDLSRKYLEWGKSNFELNQLDPAGHEFIAGDVFDWLRRLAKRQRLFEVILLDPPTFSQSKVSGVFRAEKDYDKLVLAALPLLIRGGVLFASTNAAGWPPEAFLATVKGAVRTARRRIVQEHYVPQPPDFPISRAEPAYLKTAWLRAD
jgi:23S rRNA (cytosine1962-C5)-methyltransferase